MKYGWSLVPKIAVCSLLISGGLTQAQDPQLVPVLQGLLQKYQKCILEEYENVTPKPTNPRALGPLRDPATCVAGNQCSRADRQTMYNILKAQADRGDPTNFEANLEKAILSDCFQCQKHSEFHTKQMHCTLDCNGNRNWAENAWTFDAGVGPCFEGCKAGVDITKLINDIVQDVQHVLGGAQQSQASGGPSIATNYATIAPSDPESCDSSAAGYVVAPSELLDWTPTDAGANQTIGYSPKPSPALAQYNNPPLHNIGANEGRLRKDLADAARQAIPLQSLCKSAIAFALGNIVDGNAFADLAVTGRRAFSAFRSRPPQEGEISSCAAADRRAQGMPAATLQQQAARSLNRAFDVASVLRTGGWPKACPERAALQYIAVSGEDDQPHRPVNVPSAEFPQYDLTVSVPRRFFGGNPFPVHTRYMIAHTLNPPPGGELGTCSVARRTIPADRKPVLAADAEVILYIHGMDSRLEEALDLTRALHTLATQRGKNYTVISMDLPTSGYADNIDNAFIAPLTAGGHATSGITGAGGGFAPNRYVVPEVDFIEDFIVEFLKTLNQQVPVLSHLKAIVGGSLGGNMSMRLGRRSDLPWISNVVPWSPAAIWPSMADSEINHLALAIPWLMAGGDPVISAESPGARRSFFYAGFDWQTKAFGVVSVGGGRPQAEYWYRDDWLDPAGQSCKKAHMWLARLDRYETYDQNFRRWHWRLGFEQLLFSQQEPQPGTNPPQPLYLSNTKRTLLMCGIDDTGGDLCANVQNVAPKMVYTPGRALFLQDTGHSIHNERPNFLAHQIVDFVDGPAQPQQLPALQASACPTADGVACSSLPKLPRGQETTTPLRAIVSVTSNGRPVAGASVGVADGTGGVTGAAGQVVITYNLFLYSPRQEQGPDGPDTDPRGKPIHAHGNANTATLRVPAATASKPGFQPANIHLPKPLSTGPVS